MGVIMETINDITKIAVILIFIGFIIGLAVGNAIANPAQNNYTTTTTTQTTSDQPVKQPTAQIGGCNMTDREAEALNDYNRRISEENLRLHNLVIAKNGTILDQKFQIDSLNAEIGRLKFEISILKEVIESKNK